MPNKKYENSLSPTAHIRRDRYELAFSVSNATADGARQVINGKGRFVGIPYDNRDLERACDAFLKLDVTDPIRDDDVSKLKRFIARVDELRNKKLSQPGYVFPLLTMAGGSFNIDDIIDQIGDDWDAALMKLRPFINQDLFGENIINIVVGAKRHPDTKAIKKTIRRYYMLEAAAHYRDLYLYRRGGVGIIASAFNDGVFEASGERGAFLCLNYYSANGETDSPQDGERLKAFVGDKSAGAFAGGGPHVYGICKVMNDEFCKKWLQKVEYHDGDADEGAFASYMDADVAKWHVRYHLAYALMDRVLVLNWMSDLAQKLI